MGKFGKIFFFLPMLIDCIDHCHIIKSAHTKPLMNLQIAKESDSKPYSIRASCRQLLVAELKQGIEKLRYVIFKL
jgi:hypothetical protein